MSISRKDNCGFLGFEIHRFNLAFNYFIKEKIDLVHKVTYIMKKLSFPIKQAKLKKLTPLAPIKYDKKIRSSVFCMLKLSVNIWDLFRNLDIEENHDLLLKTMKT